MVETGATDLLGEVTGIEPQFQSLALDFICNLSWHLSAALNQILMGVDLFFDKAAYGRNDHLLFFGQSKIHGVSSALHAAASAATFC